jgi:DNA-binding NarL/FixJ family response regulator
MCASVHGLPDSRTLAEGPHWAHTAGNLAYVKSILIVDDSPVIRRGLRELLEKEAGLAVCGEAENGLDAIAKAQQLLPHLIVLDLSMPVMNGLEAARKLKQLMPAVPLLMFTNHSSASLSTEAQQAGIDSLKDKCEGFDTLVVSIRRLLDDSGPIYCSA